MHRPGPEKGHYGLTGATCFDSEAVASDKAGKRERDNPYSTETQTSTKKRRDKACQAVLKDARHAQCSILREGKQPMQAKKVADGHSFASYCPPRTRTPTKAASSVLRPTSTAGPHLPLQSTADRHKHTTIQDKMQHLRHTATTPWPTVTHARAGITCPCCLPSCAAAPLPQQQQPASPVHSLHPLPYQRNHSQALAHLVALPSQTSLPPSLPLLQVGS